MPSSLRSKPSTDGLLRISDLARETGVSTATIKFYIREGLLPPPTLKTGRNMAYYDRFFVTRIRFIKELQQKRFLPLDVIKSILDQNDSIISPSEADTLLGLEGTFYEAIHFTPGQLPITVEQALERYGIDREDFEFAVRLGALEPVERGGTLYIEGDDVLMVETMSELERAGLREELIPHHVSLPIYVDAIERLAREELKMFTRAVTGKVVEGSVATMALAGVKLVERFIVLLRRKLLLRLIQELRQEKEEGRKAKATG
ncbi:MAG TPA: MerR family transcriptional regulator [Candidatus Binatia bacterium]|nr:MerR family transcriptional regulator [Candidatus Binatia bacterium]